LDIGDADGVERDVEVSGFGDDRVDELVDGLLIEGVELVRSIGTPMRARSFIGTLTPSPPPGVADNTPAPA
jgi:hypothetical protein